MKAESVANKILPVKEVEITAPLASKRAAGLDEISAEERLRKSQRQERKNKGKRNERFLCLSNPHTRTSMRRSKKICKKAYLFIV